MQINTSLNPKIAEKSLKFILARMNDFIVLRV